MSVMRLISDEQVETFQVPGNPRNARRRGVKTALRQATFVSSRFVRLADGDESMVPHMGKAFVTKAGNNRVIWGEAFGLFERRRLCMKKGDIVAGEALLLEVALW